MFNRLLLLLLLLSLPFNIFYFYSLIDTCIQQLESRSQKIVQRTTLVRWTGQRVEFLCSHTNTMSAQLLQQPLYLRNNINESPQWHICTLTITNIVGISHSPSVIIIATYNLCVYTFKEKWKYLFAYSPFDLALFLSVSFLRWKSNKPWNSVMIAMRSYFP